MTSSYVTDEGKTLIAAWTVAKRDVASAEYMLKESQEDLNEAIENLAKWLLPDDAKPGEKIAVWYGDSLIQVEVPLEGEGYVITTRLRGKRLIEADVLS